ncbi:MAG TPA: SDR family oxidoreductase [Dehalococcoidia bacterium]|nr:SDR family oxidoreductase [Dehalococcoidia bacterium]
MSEHRVVAITGASAGVGRATAREFAMHGDNIGLIARGEERLEDARRELEGMGVRVSVAPADVADPDQLDGAAEKIEAELGPIDVWINNAMTSVFAPVWQITPEEFRRVTEVTYLGQVNGAMAALKRMKPRDRGVILHVGSALAFRGIPLQSAYCGSKHAIEGFVESLRTELEHEGSHVRVATAHMPAMNTPQFDWVKSKLSHRAQPVPPIFQPEIAAEALYWMANHDRPYLLVGLPTVATVWANRIAPSLTDRYLAKTGFESQQTQQMEDPDRPDNLWAPVSGHQAAHGRFDERSHGSSRQLFVSTHLKPLLAAVGAVGATAFMLRRAFS